MQGVGGEGFLNVVNLTAAQVSNTGVGSTVSHGNGRTPPPNTPVPQVPNNATVSTVTLANGRSLPPNTPGRAANVHPPMYNVGREQMVPSGTAMSTVVTTNSANVVGTPRPAIITNVTSSAVPAMQVSMTPMRDVVASNSANAVGTVRPAIVTNATSSATSAMQVMPPMRDGASDALPPLPPSAQSGGSASIRKRSRVHEENAFVKEGLSRKRQDGIKMYQIDNMLQNLHILIEHAITKGDKSKSPTVRMNIAESFQQIGLEVCHLVTTNANLQEENRAALQQINQLQQQLSSGGQGVQSYMSALLQPSSSSNIALNPIGSSATTQIPAPLKHAPADRIIIFRAEKRGESLTKAQQQAFRNDTKRIIGDDIMNEVEVIRPTRNGGHIIIFQTSESRETALQIFRRNEEKWGISVEKSCIIAPKKRYAKVVCRDPPDDITPDEVLNDLYTKKNGQLLNMRFEDRQAKISVTRFGWIFDLSTMEAATIMAQGSRIRFGIAREMSVEEYIPIQQCYNCCMFGHSAKFCQMEQPYCRLCGDVGHAGWDCPQKENKKAWRCANCIIVNETKGTSYSIEHAAAQLHKCPCALNHKGIRKSQLAAEGIFTVPERNGLVINNTPSNTAATRRVNGAQIGGGKKRNFYNHRNNTPESSSTASSQIRNFIRPSSSASSSTASKPQSGISAASTTSNMGSLMFFQQPQQKAAYLARTTKPARPRSFDAWKDDGRQSQDGEMEEIRGRDFSYQIHGTNSVSTTQMSDMEVQQPIHVLSYDHDA